MPTDEPSQPRSIRLSEEELRQLVEGAVDNALLKLGVDAQNPLEMQQDFQHLREWREATVLIKRRGVLVITGTVVAGIIAAAWIGFKALLHIPVS